MREAGLRQGETRMPLASKFQIHRAFRLDTSDPQHAFSATWRSCWFCFTPDLVSPGSRLGGPVGVVSLPDLIAPFAFFTSDLGGRSALGFVLNLMDWYLLLTLSPFLDRDSSRLRAQRLPLSSAGPSESRPC